jgi:PLP dependent protein
VNVAGEASKQGVPLGEAETLVRYAQSLPHLEVCGLMTIAPYADHPEAARPIFGKLRAIRDSLGLEELSMGMSGDFETAVEEGATIVRVGEAIFGRRPS